jgi:hypothetical protein
MFSQAIVSFPAVCPNSCPFGYNVTDEGKEIRKRGFRNMTHSDSPKTFRFLDLDSYYNNRLIERIQEAEDDTRQRLSREIKGSEKN